jgi:hypothetical protein
MIPKPRPERQVEDVGVGRVSGRTRWGLRAVVALMVGCTAGGQPARPSPSPVPPQTATAPAPGIPKGTYALSISRRDVEGSGSTQLLNQAGGLIGRYELTLRDGSYAVTRNGRSSVPRPTPGGAVGEGAYARYGFWIFLGVPPIGKGTYTDSSSEITFRSRRGACFQKGARPSLSNGRYRWKLDQGRLSLLVARTTRNAPSGDGCLGRSYVFSAHPWTSQG